MSASFISVEAPPRMPSVSRRRSVGQRGQAAVEAALTLPLTVFLILGTVQLFTLLQARMLAQYAASRAARAGSVNSGDCLPMTHSAIAALLPAIKTLPSNDTARAMGLEFGARRSNRFSPLRDDGRNESIVWLTREGPTGIPANIEETFDLPTPDARPMNMELRLTFWAPLKIPFADWLFSRIALAHFGIEAYRGFNPLQPAQREASWEQDAGALTLPSAVAIDLGNRVRRGHYAFPIQVSYVVRMMTPPRARNFWASTCDPEDPRYGAP